MTATSRARGGQPHVDVYGLDHSPWVQAVLLGLHEKRVSHTLRTAPPLGVFWKYGILMPTASVDGRPWEPESAEILEQVGYEPVSPEDTRALYAAWRGVAHRADRASRFFGAFSRVRDPHPSLLPRLRNHFLRSFSVLYFYLLIRFMVLSRAQPDPDDFGDQFLYWEHKLEKSAGDYLGGCEPGALDMLLFGIIQCHCSIPVPPIETLQNDPRLARIRTWIGQLQRRFVGYRPLYSGVYFEPRSPAPTPAPALERAAFWIGAACMWLAAPFTVPLVVLLASRVSRPDRGSADAQA